MLEITNVTFVIVIHVSDNEMYTCKEICLLTVFHIQPISLVGIQVSDLMNTSHGRRNECYI